MKNIFKDYPYFEHPPGYRVYYCAKMGYYLGLLINQVLTKEKTSDFIEMFLHHIVTLYLFGFSYIFNQHIGSVICFLHDVSDIFVSWTRIWGESNYNILTGTGLISILLTWVYTRILVFGEIIYMTMTVPCFMGASYILAFFSFLLSCLWVLNAYWFIMMCKILVNVVLYNKVEDTQNKIVDDEDETNKEEKSE